MWGYEEGNSKRITEFLQTLGRVVHSGSNLESATRECVVLSEVGMTRWP